MTSFVLDELTMQHLLQVEDVALKSFTQGMIEIESFIDSFKLNPVAMSQICDVLLTYNVNSSATSEMYSFSLLQKLCDASVHFANNPVVGERIFAAIGTILEHPQRIESGTSSILMCVKRLCGFLSSAPRSMVVTPMSEAAGFSLDQAIHAVVVCQEQDSIVESVSNSEALSCTTCMQYVVQHLDRVQHARSMFHLYIAVGNLIALVSGEQESAVVTTALERGVVEISCRTLAAFPTELNAQSGVWHLLEQLVSCKCGKEYFLRCPLDTFTMACNTHANFCTEEQELKDESTSSIVSSVHRVLTNVVIGQSAIANILTDNNTLFRTLHVLRSIESTTSDVVWSGLTMLWNAMLSASEGSRPCTHWLCIEQSGWDIFLDSFVQFQGDSRIEGAACDTLYRGATGPLDGGFV
jgi:hypothetical protein